MKDIKASKDELINSIEGLCEQLSVIITERDYIMKLLNDTNGTLYRYQRIMKILHDTRIDLMEMK
jgi:hypothetical protein